MTPFVIGGGIAFVAYWIGFAYGRWSTPGPKPPPPSPPLLCVYCGARLKPLLAMPLYTPGGVVIPDEATHYCDYGYNHQRDRVRHSTTVFFRFDPPTAKPEPFHEL